MKIAYLKMKNFMLYKKFNKSFEHVDVCGIICEYKTNKKKSNRGGKTTIMEAIKYALHGNTRAKKEIKLIHNGEEFMEVELGLIDDGGKIYKIRRGRDHKNNGLLECDWVDKKKEAQKEINLLVGCNKEEFELINYFKQSDINKFMLLPANEKKEHLMKWLDNTHWNKLFNAVDVDLKDKRKQLAKKHTKKETILEDLGDKGKIEKRVDKTKNKIKERKKKVEALNVKYKKLQKKHRSGVDIEDLKQQQCDVLEQINDLNNSIDENSLLKEESKSLIKKAEKIKRKVKKLNFDCNDRKEYYGQQKVYEKEANVLEDLLDKLEDEEGTCGICPLLNESCDRIMADPKRIKEVKKKLSIIDKDCQNLQKEIDRFDNMEARKERVKEVKKAASELRARWKQPKPLKTKLKALKRRYESLSVSLERGQEDISDKLEMILIKASNQEKGLDELNQKLGQYKSRIQQIEKANEKVLKIDKSVKKLEVEIEDLKYLSLMFGKNGIPSQEIENAFCEIESDINFLLGKITSFEVSFNADKELGKWESECVGCGWTYRKGYRKKECEECGEPRNRKRKDELHLTIVEHGYESDFELDSGGGQTFISFAVRIALTLLKRRKIASQLDVLFLDEIDSALDEDAREQIMKLVWLLVKSLGFKQIFMVSHNKKIKESVPHTLLVQRYEKHAKAKWV